MEKNYIKGQHESKKIIGSFSVVLSFVIAIVAVFSLATFGVVSNQGRNAISYAETAGFILKEDTSLIVRGVGTYGGGTVGRFQVPVYKANELSGSDVFCVEYQNPANVNGSYTIDNTPITDYGLLYLFHKLESSPIAIEGLTDSDPRLPYVRSWLKQAAIWVYLAETSNPLGANSLDNTDAGGMGGLSHENNLSIVKSANTIEFFSATGSGLADYVETSSLYTKYVEGFVTEAKGQTGDRTLGLTSNTTSSPEANLTADGDYYKSPLYTVSGEGLQSYKLSATGDFTDVKFFDASDNEIDITANIDKATKFYVRVPASEVTENVKNLGVDIVGTFDWLEGKYFVSSAATPPWQKVISVTGTNVTRNGSLGFQVYKAPDTKMSAAQTIYFIGLIVLLCGVGIVYANAKPVESKQ